MSSDPTAPRRGLVGVAGVLLLLALLVAGLELPVAPGRGFLWLALWNFTHLPAFIATAWLLWRLSAAWPGRRVSRLGRYLLVLGVGGLFGAGTEALQFFGPRDADLFDLLRNLQGLVAGTLVIAVWDVELLPRSTTGRAAVRTVALAAVVAVILHAAWPIAVWAGAYRQRDLRFPVLCDFEGPDERRFLTHAGATIELVASPDGTWLPSGEHVARVTYRPGIYPRVALLQPCPDWSAYATFVLEVWSPETEPFDAVLRIDDELHDETYQDRFNRTLRIPPGASTFRVALDDVRTAPQGRELDLTRVRSVALFLERTERPVTLFTDDWRLEGERVDPPRAKR